MSLPQFDRVLFKKAPLSLVIGQVRFPVLLRFGETGFIAPFQEAIRSEYPKHSRDQQMTLKISQQGVEKGAGETLWRFASRRNDWTVSLGEGAITLEARAYSNIEEFLSRFERILNAARESFGIDLRTRLGLRYIDEIRYPNANSITDWGQLMRPEFVGFAASDLFDGQITTHIAQIQIKRTDGIIDVRHGFLKGSVTQPSEGNSPETSPFYLIDQDYYDPVESDFDVGATLDQMRNFSDFMYQFFRWALGPTLYDCLKPQNAE